MKTQNSVSQKIRILHKINNKWFFKQKCQASEKYVHFYVLNTLLGLLCMNYCINAAWHEGDQSVALIRCNEAKVVWIVAFRSNALLGLVSLIFLLTIPHRLSMGSDQATLQANQAQYTMVIEPAFGIFGSVGRCQILLENEISISIKLVSRRKHEML